MQQEYEGKTYDVDAVLDAVAQSVGIQVKDGKFSIESNTKQIFGRCYRAVTDDKIRRPRVLDEDYTNHLSTRLLPEYVLKYYVKVVEQALAS